MIRNGYLAVWQGEEYEASPASDGTVRLYSPTEQAGFEAVTTGRYRRVVPATEVSALRYVRTTCQWRGLRYVVIGEYNAWLRLELWDSGPIQSGEWDPQQLGLERFDDGVYQCWAPRGEVTELRQEYV